jgi:hypothetical protein
VYRLLTYLNGGAFTAFKAVFGPKVDGADGGVDDDGQDLFGDEDEEGHGKRVDEEEDLFENEGGGHSEGRNSGGEEVEDEEEDEEGSASEDEESDEEQSQGDAGDGSPPGSGDQQAEPKGSASVEEPASKQAKEGGKERKGREAHSVSPEAARPANPSLRPSERQKVAEDEDKLGKTGKGASKGKDGKGKGKSVPPPSSIKEFSKIEKIKVINHVYWALDRHEGKMGLPKVIDYVASALVEADCAIKKSEIGELLSREPMKRWFAIREGSISNSDNKSVLVPNNKWPTPNDLCSLPDPFVRPSLDG